MYKINQEINLMWEHHFSCIYSEKLWDVGFSNVSTSIMKTMPQASELPRREATEVLEKSLFDSPSTATLQESLGKNFMQI